MKDDARKEQDPATDGDFMPLDAIRPRDEHPDWITIIDGLDPLSEPDAQLGLSADGTKLGVADGNVFRVYRIDAEGVSAEVQWTTDCGERITAVEPVSGGRFVLATGGDRVELSIADEEMIQTLTTLPGSPQSVAVGGSRVFVATASDDETAPELLVIDIRSGTVVRSTTLTAGPISLTTSLSGRYVTVANRRTKQVWTIRTDKECNGIKWEKSNDRCEKGIDGEPGDDGSVVVVKPDGSATERPRDDQDPDHPPCQLQLSWPIQELVTANGVFVATDANRHRLAVVNRRGLSVLAEVATGAARRTIVTNPHATRLLSFDHHRRVWEHLDFEELVRTLPPLVSGVVSEESGEEDIKPMTFFGQREFSLSLGHATTNDTTRVLAVPMIEPGQTFTDPDLTTFATFMQREAWEPVREYYDEVTFGVLDMQIQLFGHDIGPGGTPIRLPRSFRSYFWPDYTPGGLQIDHVLPSVPMDVRLDGTESATIRIVPRIRSPEVLLIPFCALGTSEEYDTFPVKIQFDGTETAELKIEDQTGTTHTLNLSFDAQTFSIAQASVDADLRALETYLDTIIDDAESAAGISLLEPVSLRRVKKRGVNFGNLELDLSLKPSAGTTGKGMIKVVNQTGLEPIGLDNPTVGVFSFGAGGAAESLDQYLERALRLAETDANIDFTNRYIGGSSVTFDGTTGELTIAIQLSNDNGGSGANIQLQSHNGLDALGTGGAMSVPGSTSTVNNQNTMRDIRDLSNYVYTELVARLGGGDRSAFFQQFNAIMLCYVGAPDQTVPASEHWGASSPDIAGLRMYLRGVTATNAADPNDTLQATWIGTILRASPQNATTIHELGHVLGFPDLYRESSHRDDLAYMEDWAMMDRHWRFPHFCGYHKLQAGWIKDGTEPRDDNDVRVVQVPRPVPDSTTSVEVLLVPVEYWDAGMKTAVRNAFNGSVPIAQLMKINLGGDGVQFALVEARQRGQQFSQSLPTQPAVLLSNAIEPDDDTRYAERGKYRRKVHRLNTGFDLDTTGETFDLAAAPELAAKGVTATVVEQKSVTRPYGQITVFHVRIEREPADYVDLAFTETTPNWRSPDVYVDWVGDNVSPDPDDHRVYPVGSPLDQGEKVRFPSSGTEPHWIVGRVWNRGTIQANNVELNYYICDPPGSGDRGNFKLHRTRTVNEVRANDYVTVPSNWAVNNATNSHSCLRIEIGDWKLPADPASAVALASDDLWLSNNWAQQNVNEFVPVSGSPYTPVQFQYSVANDGLEPERVRLEPDGLPEGMKLTISPGVRMVQPDEVAIFDCTLELNHQVIDSGCEGDREFLIMAWRETPHTQERWGAVHYTIRPREESMISLKGYWGRESIVLYGSVTPAPTVGERVLLRLAFAFGDTRWHETTIRNGGSFRTEIDVTDNDEESEYVEVLARYEGNQDLAPAESNVVQLYQYVPLL
jgi:M6 family metalloprotease-like protein